MQRCRFLISHGEDFRISRAFILQKRLFLFNKILVSRVGMFLNSNSTALLVMCFNSK